ncbi:MAG: type II toxin-antitoxin system Phd/YefM family antitoxin [Blastocatellia bacterium]
MNIKVDRKIKIEIIKVMNKVTVEEIKQNLDIWLQKAEMGEELQVVINEKVMLELKPINKVEEKQRPYGLCKGEFVVPKEFDDPLPKEILADFE